MSQLKGKALVEEELLKLAPGVRDKIRSAYERSEVGARRFSRLVKWGVEPRIHVSKTTGHVTLRFIEIGASMTSLIFIDHNTVDYRASVERDGVEYAPYCQGIDQMTNALTVIKAFGVNVFTH
jgi:hypothetical protein